MRVTKEYAETVCRNVSQNAQFQVVASFKGRVVRVSTRNSQAATVLREAVVPEHWSEPEFQKALIDFMEKAVPGSFLCPGGTQAFIRVC